MEGVPTVRLTDKSKGNVIRDAPVSIVFTKGRVHLIILWFLKDESINLDYLTLRLPLNNLLNGPFC